MLDLSQVLTSINGVLLSKSNEAIFTGVSTDSRKIRKDELFFALHGSNFDGHDFVLEALEKGAKGAVIKIPLSLKCSVLKNTGNFNNLFGLPLTLLKLRECHNGAVVEFGMNDFGEIRRL